MDEAATILAVDTDGVSFVDDNLCSEFSRRFEAG